MAHHRKKYPTKVIGNKCMFCQWRLVLGNSKNDMKRGDRRAYDSARLQLEERST